MIDYYAILNVDPTANKKEIKNAFKRQASIWHPDRNNSPNATKKMQLIIEAKLILLDDEARVKYDFQYCKFKETPVNKQKSFDNEIREDEIYCNDETLNTWILKARKQALELAALSFDDLHEMSKEVVSEVWDKIKYPIVVLIVANIIFAIFL